MAVVYSGEAYLGNQYNEDLAYVIPKEGSNVWLDSWCVTKQCDNVDAAQQFLDFLCREDVAEMNFEYSYYSTPNEKSDRGLSGKTGQMKHLSRQTMRLRSVKSVCSWIRRSTI